MVYVNMYSSFQSSPLSFLRISISIVSRITGVPFDCFDIKLIYWVINYVILKCNDFSDFPYPHYIISGKGLYDDTLSYRILHMQYYIFICKLGSEHGIFLVFCLLKDTALYFDFRKVALFSHIIAFLRRSFDWYILSYKWSNSNDGAIFHFCIAYLLYGR